MQEPTIILNGITLGPMDVPPAPEILPPAEQKKWAKAYQDELEAAFEDEPDRETKMRLDNIENRHRRAMKKANRLLTVKPPANLAEAQAMPDWQVIKRGEENVILDQGGNIVPARIFGSRAARIYKVVTIDGRKYFFVLD